MGAAFRVVVVRVSDKSTSPLAKSRDDFEPNRPFRDADLNRNLVLCSEHKAETTSANLETVAFNVTIVCCN